MNDEKFARLEAKLDQIDARLDEITKVQVSQAADLKHHIYRTELAERRLSMIEEDQKPIKNHVIGVQFLGKVLLASASIAGAIAGVLKLME